MSSIQLDDERDGEALRRAQRAHEPSMEEILASIRAIIADDKAVAAAKVAAPARATPAAGSQVIYSAFGQKLAEPPAPTVVWSKPDDGEAEAEAPAVEGYAQPTEAEAEPVEAQAPMIVEPAPPTEAGSPAYQQPSPIVEEARRDAPSARPDAPGARAEAPLLSMEADRIVAASFQALAASLAIPDPQRVEQMSRELLRPMLKTWLDENLPSLVERLVRAEIQRVARGSR